MILQNAYGILFHVGVCNTKAQFSRDWLGASPSYFTSMEARQRQPNMMALMVLAARLELLVDRLAADPRYHDQRGVLERLLDDLWDNMRGRALAAAPQRRAGRDACGV
ncbi:DUF6626 family protein [Azospirillum palustre]